MFVYCHLELVRADVPELAREFHRRFAPDHELLHGDDTVALAGLATPEHLRSDPVASRFKQNRMPVRCCQYAFDLLLKYLHVANQMAMLSVLNENVAVTVTAGDPSPSDDAFRDAARSTATGAGPPSKVDLFNAKKQGRWGLLERSVEIQALDAFEEERARAEKDDDDGDDENRDGSKSVGSKRSRAAAAAAAAAAAKKEAEDVSNRGKTDASVPTIVKSEIPVPELSYQARLDAVEDVRYRNELNAEHLPSCAFFTFTHAHGFLNCATVSRDASLVAGGFADSVVRVWDVNKAVPGGSDTYETDPESRARRAAKDAALDAPAAERGEAGGAAEAGRASVDPATATGGPIETASPNAPTDLDAAKLDRNSKVARPTPCVEFVGHASAVHGVSISPGNEFLASCARDASVRVWSVELETCLASYRGHEYPVWDVKWAPTGHYFATASYDKTARVWSMDAPTPRRVMVGHLASVDAVAWHPNCNYVATGSADKTVRLWDVASGECVRIFVGHGSGVRAVAVHPDGKSMASASDDGGILVWDLGTAKCSHAFSGHEGSVYSLAYAGGVGCGVLASGGEDETVRLWDASAAPAGPSGGVSSPSVKKTVGSSGGGETRGGALETFRTKNTPVCCVEFTGRNLLLAAGARAPTGLSKKAR
jgi:transcription initiation factor TFIID subunit 5